MPSKEPACRALSMTSRSVSKMAQPGMGRPLAMQLAQRSAHLGCRPPLAVGASARQGSHTANSGLAELRDAGAVCVASRSSWVWIRRPHAKRRFKFQLNDSLYRVSTARRPGRSPSESIDHKSRSGTLHIEAAYPQSTHETPLYAVRKLPTS